MLVEVDARGGTGGAGGAGGLGGRAGPAGEGGVGGRAGKAARLSEYAAIAIDGKNGPNGPNGRNGAPGTNGHSGIVRCPSLALRPAPPHSLCPLSLTFSLGWGWVCARCVLVCVVLCCVLVCLCAVRCSSCAGLWRGVVWWRQSGLSGANGSVSWQVLDPDKSGLVLERALDRYHACVTGYRVWDDNSDGVFEPGSKLRVTSVQWTNYYAPTAQALGNSLLTGVSGGAGLTLPAGAILSFPSTKSVLSVGGDEDGGSAAGSTGAGGGARRRGARDDEDDDGEEEEEEDELGEDEMLDAQDYGGADGDGAGGADGSDGAPGSGGGADSKHQTPRSHVRTSSSGAAAASASHGGAKRTRILRRLRLPACPPNASRCTPPHAHFVLRIPPVPPARGAPYRASANIASCISLMQHNFPGSIVPAQFTVQYPIQVIPPHPQPHGLHQCR
jgi:hypothetical protein